MQKIFNFPERIKNIILFLLFVTSVTLLLLIGCTSGDKKVTEKTASPSSPLFRKPIPDSVSRPLIDSFRRIYTHDRTNGILYDSAVLRNYLDSIYPYLKARMGEMEGYEWKIGFYWMRRMDTTVDGTPRGRRLNFLVVPTRVKISDGSVIDFRDYPDAYRDRHNPLSPFADPPCSNCSGYDAGQLWP